ncbi:hypothetical protein Hamer_G027218 [Homarus americanus]|uniref:Uncharacterized protein n=1 Tax=Homarus americanus TaxID=6706 RepID=A0A8J5N1N7_HOMAM|nr:hypothetical protein Hamer_G027218 [Homarus americanus]
MRGQTNTATMLSYGRPARDGMGDNEVKHIIKKNLITAGCRTHKEPQIYRSNNKRQDGITPTPWKDA